MDKKNHRYFVIQRETSMASDKELHSELSTCFAKTDWGNDWHISLFSEARFAGYKDEKKIIPLHKNNQWSKAYLAEYDGIMNSVTKQPALPKNH